MLNVEIALRPRERPSRVTEVKWSNDARDGDCSDSPELPKEVEQALLPPEVIQRIIRDRYPVIRRCYEAQLGSNPRLQGRVVTRFVIGRDGRVFGAHVLENDVADCRVAQCVRDEIAKCVFPNPEYGLVVVVYPIMFAQG